MQTQRRVIIIAIIHGEGTVAIGIVGHGTELSITIITVTFAGRDRIPIPISRVQRGIAVVTVALEFGVPIAVVVDGQVIDRDVAGGEAEEGGEVVDPKAWGAGGQGMVLASRKPR